MCHIYETTRYIAVLDTFVYTKHNGRMERRRRHNPVAIATEIRDGLRKQQTTPDELAAAVGVTTADVYEWLDADKSPSIEELVGICRFLQIPLEEFGARTRVAA